MTLTLPLNQPRPTANSLSEVETRVETGQVTWARTLGAVMFRSAAFLALQAAVALLVLLAGRGTPWDGSVAWWPLGITLASLATLALLVRLARGEGIRYADLLNGSRHTIGRDLLWVFVLSLLSGPLAYFPMLWLSDALFSDPQAASLMMFRPLPVWLALVLLVLMPLAIALSELPVYLGYAMPRLEALSGKAWLAVLLPAFFLALQHVFLPLILDPRFMLWRFGMFVPFALMVAIAVRLRPSLLPYLVAGHFLLDFSLSLMVYLASTGRM